MLQQTQVDRVIPKYTAFIKRFPTVTHLSTALNSDVLEYWQGLGYNRRALYLKKTAEIIVTKYKEKFPSDIETLLTLPGIGQSTASAILNFSFSKATPFIETNIRTVFIQYFFSKKSLVDDRDILPLVERTMDYKNPREWFYALYDYGTKLKATLGKQKTEVHKKSTSYVKQSRFDGSFRQIRGIVLRAILALKKQRLSRATNRVTGEIKKVGKVKNVKNTNSLADKTNSFTAQVLKKSHPECLLLSTADIQKALISLEKEGFIRKNAESTEFAIL